MTVSTKKSFRFKLLVWILGVSLFLFSLIFASCFYFSYREVYEGVSSNVTSRLDYVKRALDKGLSCAEVSSNNVISVISSPMFNHEGQDFFKMMQSFLDANPEVCGIAFGYNPALTPGGKGYAPYVRKNADGTFTNLNLAQLKEYWKADWYATAYERREPYWAKPFLESNGNLITCINTPICGPDGTCVGVLAVDLDLMMVSDSLQNIRPYPNSELFIVDQDGRFVAHPDRSCLYNGRISDEIKDAVLSGESYYTSYKRGKEDIYVFYSPEPKTGWIIYMEIPGKVMGANVTNLIKSLLFNFVLGLILLLIVSYVVITKVTKPLETFAGSAQQISHGNFDVELPVIKDRNELYDLRQSLACMKVSLDDYVAKLAETSMKEAKMENELNIARGIQTSMVPKVFPPILDCRNMDVYASMDPAQAVGGDLYDFAIFGDYMYFCIGDVSGKGVPASLFMAITRSLFRNLASEMKNPQEIAMSLNDAVCESNEQNMFVTMFIGRCNLTNGDVDICNCGHNHPVVYNNGEVYLFDNAPTNIPIGVIQGFPYVAKSTHVGPGAMLLLYTDGITEAEDKAKNLFGDDRMLASVKKTLEEGDLKAKTILEKLLVDVHAFTAGAEQNDDITGICLIYKG